MNIILIAILTVNLALFVLFAVVFIKIARVYRELQGFIKPGKDNEGKDTPSPLAMVVSTTADMIARSLVAQIKSTFMGKQSGEVRGEQAVVGDIAFDAIGQVNPVVGAVLNSFPSLKKTLKRNPALLDFALSKLAGSNQAKQAIMPALDNNPSASVKFKL